MMLNDSETGAGTVLRIRSRLKPFKGIPSLVPFLSVFFILLIFFMICTNFVPVRGVPVMLPHTAGELTYAAKSLIVTIDKDGNIYFEDTLFSGADKNVLKRRISDTRRVTGKKKQHRDELIIRSDVRGPQDKLLLLFSVAKELDMNVILVTAGEEQTRKVITLKTEE